MFEAGAKAVGYTEVSTGRMAINSIDNDERHELPADAALLPGLQMGRQVVDAYTDIPKGEATGSLGSRGRPRPCGQTSSTTTRASVTGVEYFDKDGALQFQAARIVAVAGNSFESPRLLLNSASEMFPDGLANSSGQVGRNYMRHTTGSVYAVFEKPVHFYRGTTMAGIVRDEAKHDPSRGFVGGYELETLALGVPFMAAFLDPGGWGRPFASAMDSYANMAGLWIVGEDMPQEQNAVEAAW